MVIVYEYEGAAKNMKINIAQIKEKGVDPEKQIDDETTVLDGMALVRKIKTSGRHLVKCQIYFYKESLIMVGIQGELFDAYRDHSIKKAERTRRGSGTLLFQNLNPTQPIKQWNQFLSSSQNKKELVNHWRQKTPSMGNKHLYIGYEHNCICFSP